MPPIWLLSLIVRTGIPSRFAKLAAGVAAVLFFALIIGLLVAGYRNWLTGQREEAVTLDRADISAEVANRVIEADRSANANATVADVAVRENEKELDDAIAEPSPNSSRVSSVLERMREQQRAGRR